MLGVNDWHKSIQLQTVGAPGMYPSEGRVVSDQQNVRKLIQEIFGKLGQEDVDKRANGGSSSRRHEKKATAIRT